MPRAWVIGVIAFICLTFIAGAYPAYRAFSSWRAENLARSAEEMIKQGNITEGLEALTFAIRKDQDNYEVLRKRALIYTQLGHPDTLIIWTRLRQLHGLSEDDRREYARAALLFGQSDLADKIMSDAEGKNATIEDILLRYQIAFSRSRFGLAEDLAREALLREPDNKDVIMSMAHALLLQKDPMARKRAQEILKEMKGGDDLFSLQALLLLASDETITDDSRLDATERILNHPSSDFDKQLIAWRIQIKLQPEKTQDILDYIIALATESDDPYQLAQAGRLLNQLDESKRIPELIDFDRAKYRRDLLLILLDAWAEEDRWDLIEDSLNVADIALEPFFIKLFKFRSHIELGREAEAEALFSNLVSPGPKYEDRLRTFADYLFKLKRYDYARKLYAIMKNNALIARTGYIGLINIEKRVDNLIGVIDLLKEMSQEFPADEAAANEYNYYRILAGKDTSEAIRSANSLYKSNPKMMAFRITLALGHLRQQQPQKGYKLLNIRDLKWEELDDQRKTVRCAILRASGRNTEANELQKEIRADTLMSAEKRLIGLK